MLRKPLAVAALGLVAALSTGGVATAASRHDPAGERQSEASYTDAHRSDATVSQPAAEKEALALHRRTATDTHLENEGHGLRWEVKPDDGHQVWEVQVDAHTGKVVSDHLDD
jgi:uncharacterized membrane protein YkoI